MKRLLILVVATLLIGFPSSSFAQDTKTAHGTVTAIDGSSLTVKVGDKDWVFVVDAKSEIIASGASTKTRAAKAEGKAHPSLADVIHVGNAVEVKYHEAGMHAASIRVVNSVPAATTGTTHKSMNATGVVSAITPASLTIKGAADEWTFVVDNKTRVIGRGAGTTTRQKEAAGDKTSVADLVASGDTVIVKYHEMDGAKHAAEVRVTKKIK